MKKFISILLVLIFILSSMAVIANAEEKGKWIAAWGTSPVDYFISLEDYVNDLRVNGAISAGTTIRTEIVVTAAGEKLRFKFSNQYGDTPVVISEATVAKTGNNSASIKGDVYGLTFNGNKKLTLEAGQVVWSDPVNMKVEAREKISISTYYASGAYIKTAGLFGGESYESTGISSQCYSKRLSMKTEIEIAAKLYTFYVIPFLTDVDVYSPSDDAFSIAFIGDSTLVNDTTSYINQRLIDAGYDNIGVIDEGIMGNRLLYNGNGLLGTLYGDRVLDRFDRDALNITAADVIFVKIGANDIVHPTSKTMNAPYASVEEITTGYKQLIKMAKDAGKKIYFMEITPWNGYVRKVLSSKADIKWNKDLQVMTDEVNAWIRNEAVSNGADGYFSAPTLCDIADTTKLAAQFTIDGAHLTSYGSTVLCDCIDLQSALGLDKEVRSISEILKVDPYSAKSTDSSESSVKQTVSNVLNFVRQLATSLRIQLEGVRDFFATITERQYLRTGR